LVVDVVKAVDPGVDLAKETEIVAAVGVHLGVEDAAKGADGSGSVGDGTAYALALIGNIEGAVVGPL